MFKVKAYSLLLILTLFVMPVFLHSDKTQSYASPNTAVKPACEPNISIATLHNKGESFRVGLQAGHVDSHLLPDELARLRENTGTFGGGKQEWEVNQEITALTAEILKKQGVAVDILPATIPPGYIADAFIAVHADVHEDDAVSGFKSSGFIKDQTGKGSTLSHIMDQEYIRTSCMKLDDHITRNMRYYYAFSYDRFEHTIHPDTPGVIVETGFMSNQEDLDMLINNPEIAAAGIANGIITFLNP